MEQKETPLIGVTDFARRHHRNSPFSYYERTWTDLCELIANTPFLALSRQGYRDGVLLVDVAPAGFYCGVVDVATSPNVTLKAVFEARREGEAPYLQVRATRGDKLPAAAVEVVLYRSDVLEPQERGDFQWGIVSINARPTAEPEPPTPMAMARNFLNLPGGTAATYTAEQFAEAIIYWSTRAMCTHD